MDEGVPEEHGEGDEQGHGFRVREEEGRAVAVQQGPVRADDRGDEEDPEDQAPEGGQVLEAEAEPAEGADHGVARERAGEERQPHLREECLRQDEAEEADEAPAARGGDGEGARQAEGQDGRRVTQHNNI